MTYDPDGKLALDSAARLLKQDKVTLKARDRETGEVTGTLTFTVTERDADGLPVKVAVERVTDRLGRGDGAAPD